MADNKTEEKLIEVLRKRRDPEAKRLKRFLDMSDLTRTPGSPLAELVKRIVNLPRFSDFEVLKAPEIIPYDISFNLFNFPADHPARNPSDTYFVDKDHILRTHTTVMWYYHLALPGVWNKIKKGESVSALSYGKVYRKDEIDRSHMNVFHQMDGWYLCRRKDHIITINDLKDVLIEIAQAIFGKNTKYRFNTDKFPYTDPSPKRYNGWAFGFGLERLAITSMDLPDIRLLWSQDERVKKQLKLGNKYKEVSKFPPITRDISFIAGKDFVPNNYFDLIRDIGGILVEEVRLIDKYEDLIKFGPDRSSYTYRLIYRSSDRTLLSNEVDKIQEKIYSETAKQFNAKLR
ncbi:MAG: hypothetical protein UV48_C0023G0009 [Candidatus Azambacteria bacterium GW2011_GWA2_42_9]|uniref:FDX-ACB domain-containing protein n=1 Tax=Candidatus Azambacteria bacterium GW2011_GWA2_42_9 TaxID=1618613 RepID=A0A0G1DVY8_9BACT|nr:MAG: hypothetical protein UV48_C0023G0009 [Candidatus Azambacteria bacterium GW2011_GWA2_42_9]